MKPVSFGKAPPRLLRSVLEVERKFIPCIALSSRLRANKETPAFKNLAYIGHSYFEDIYYDHDDMLFSKGMWVRNRSGVWQAKVRRGGNFTNSQFQELSDVGDIETLVEQVTGRPYSKESAFGLTKFAQFVTFRQSWEADNDFEIVLDETNFGHRVGEVELKKPIEDNKVSSEDMSNWGEQLDDEIAAFMHKYQWLWLPGDAVGKLAAYCADMPSGRHSGAGAKRGFTNK